jgi:hypothetical protein
MLVLAEILEDGDTASIGVESSTITPPLSSRKSEQNRIERSGQVRAYNCVL